jgi:aryl-alcohol dehydrogenase-like predicted oxidoreductase
MRMLTFSMQMVGTHSSCVRPSPYRRRQRRVSSRGHHDTADTGKTFAQTALNWVLGRPGVCSAIFAARTEAQLADNLAAVGWHLTPQQVALLDRASEQPPAYPYSHQHLFPTNNLPPVPYYHVVKL